MNGNLVRVFVAVGLLASACLPSAYAQQTDTATQQAEKRPAQAGGLDLDPEGAGPDPLAKDDNSNGPLIAPGASEAQSPQSEADTTVAAPPTDPLVLAVRARLAENRDTTKGDDKADVAGLTAFYAGNDAKLIWTDANGLNEKAKKVIREIKNADDWGLDASAFYLPQPAGGTPLSEADIADAEIKLSRAVLKYARHARGGRFDPAATSTVFDQKPPLFEPKSVLVGISASNAPDLYLKGLHPKHPGFVRLRQALLKLKSASAEPAPVNIPKGPTLKLGDQNEQVARVRQHLNVRAEAGMEATLDQPLANAIKAYQKSQGLKETGEIDARLRASLNGPDSDSVEQKRLRILANMERWRWLPEDLGAFHLENNIPEQVTRVFKDGQNILTERIVVGKPQNPTPVFSANMQFVIFHPEWGVPDGIKTNELAPKLRRASGYYRGEDDGFWFFGRSFGGNGSSRVLQSYGLRVSYNGREVDPETIDWSSVDIRRFQFIQPSGGKNVLGVVKFRFPNKHDVYMHDTPDKHLFNNFPRAYSHGCMRTQNPVRLAEVLLEHDKGWSSDKIRAMAGGDNSSPNEIKLSTVIPVHVTYFTAVAGDDGTVKFHADVYGLDSKLASAIAKKSVRFSDSGEVREVNETSSRQTVSEQRPRSTPPRRRSRGWDDDDDSLFLWGGN